MDTSNQKHGTVSKGIRFPEALADQVQALADRQHRTFSGQVIFMVEEFLHPQTSSIEGRIDNTAHSWAVRES